MSARGTVLVCRRCGKPITHELHGAPWRVPYGERDSAGGQHYVYPLHYDCAERVKLELPSGLESLKR